MQISTWPCHNRMDVTTVAGRWTVLQTHRDRQPYVYCCNQLWFLPRFEKSRKVAWLVAASIIPCRIKSVPHSPQVILGVCYLSMRMCVLGVCVCVCIVHMCSIWISTISVYTSTVPWRVFPSSFRGAHATFTGAVMTRLARLRMRMGLIGPRACPPLPAQEGGGGGGRGGGGLMEADIGQRLLAPNLVDGLGGVSFSNYFYLNNPPSFRRSKIVWTKGLSL